MLKLSDFGNSGIVVADSGKRPLPSDHTALQQGLCTLNYAAPEILQKLQYDFKSDVWSAGVIMYEMLQENPSSIAIKPVDQTHLLWCCPGHGNSSAL